MKSLLSSDNLTVSYVARIQSQNCRSIFGQNIRHIIVNNNLSWYELEKYTTNAIKKHMIDKYMNSLNNNYFNYSTMIRDLIIEKESLSARLSPTSRKMQISRCSYLLEVHLQKQAFVLWKNSFKCWMWHRNVIHVCC